MSEKPRAAFISGPLDATEEYFTRHYKPRIDQAIQEGNNFVIGPVAGVDTMSLHYLLSKNVSPSRITIYMASFEYHKADWRKKYQDLGVSVEEVGDMHATTRHRDAKMTEESDYDILRYRSEDEAKEWYGDMWWPRVSNTEMNERRRKGIWSQEYGLHVSVAPLGAKEGDEVEKKKHSISARVTTKKILGKR